MKFGAILIEILKFELKQAFLGVLKICTKRATAYYATQYKCLSLVIIAHLINVN